MQKKILINGIMLEDANIVPLLSKAKYWMSIGYRIDFLGNLRLKTKIDDSKMISDYDLIEIKSKRKTKNNKIFMIEAFSRNIRALRQLTKIKDEYDIIYSISSTLDVIIAPYFLKNINKKIVWATVFDNIVPFGDPGNKFIKFLAWFFFKVSLLLLKKASRIFIISDDLKYFLLKNGFNDTALVVTGNGVENDLIKAAQMKSAYNIDALFVGRINETKGIYDMLDVLMIVKQRFPGFQLAIMGRGDEITENQFKKKIKQNNLENNIQLLGYKIGLEKFRIMKSSKAFLFLSKSESESFGVALLEAVCCGLPAFVYDLKPFRKLYKNNEVFTFKINDYISVAEKVIELFTKGFFKNKKGELLLDRYSWDRIAETEVNAFTSY